MRALFALVFFALVACDDEVIPPKNPSNKVSMKELTPAERRDAACKAKTLPTRESIKTNDGAAEIPSGTVARVDVDGVGDVAAAHAAIGIAPGEQVSVEKTQAAMRKLFALGDVDDVRLDTKTSPQGIVLHFMVDHRPKLGEIVLHGGTIYDAPEISNT